MLKKLIKAFLKVLAIIRLKANNVQIGKHVVLNGLPYIVNRGKFIIGNSVTMNLSFPFNPIGGERQMIFIIEKNAVLEIKDRAGISNSAFFCRKNITIEEDVFIGGGCKIYDTDFHSISYKDRILMGDINAKLSPVTIKKGAFIGGHTIILKGVTVGCYSVVGAGSVVTQNIPDGEVWAGNPAKFIKKVQDCNANVLY